MDSFVLVFFCCSVLILGSSQGELAEEAVIVHPMVFENRESSFEKLLVIHDGHSLKLTKASVLAEKLLLRDITDNGVVDRYVDGKLYENALYQDSEQLASLVVKPQSKGDYHIEGVVNSTHFIRPLLTMERSLSGRTAHKLSSLEVSKNAHDSVMMSRHASYGRISARKTANKLTLPKNFTIEMVFISAYDHTKHFKNDAHRINYVSVLMLAVGLRLQRLDPPGRIMLTAILSCSTRRTEYNYVRLSKDGVVLGEPTLKQVWKRATVNERIQTADMVYLATMKSIKRADNLKRVDNSTVLGLALIEGACGKDKVAIGKDIPGTYSGLQTAPHEIGHLLGCHHDSGSCSGEYIMHSHSGGKRHYEWSKCSKEAVKKFLQSSKSKCLHNINERFPIAVLPNKTVEVGDVINGEEYCLNYFPNYHNVTYIKTPPLDTCRIYCKIKDSRNISSLVGILAPEGTPCNKDSPKMKCVRGTCWW
uniref:Reprolysin n=1 Tax=Rhipicephalus appendiculatus TaxID=34631 RepID=A0A131Z3H4_RHIAP